MVIFALILEVFPEIADDDQLSVELKDLDTDDARDDGDHKILDNQTELRQRTVAEKYDSKIEGFDTRNSGSQRFSLVYLLPLMLLFLVLVKIAERV